MVRFLILNFKSTEALWNEEGKHRSNRSLFIQERQRSSLPYQWFYLLQSVALQKHYIENSRNKQFTGFKLCSVPSSMMESCTILLLPTWDANRPFAQHLLAVDAPSRLSLSSHLSFRSFVKRFAVLVFKSPLLYLKMSPKLMMLAIQICQG